LSQVGFIGLGSMGKPMALNLLKKGYSVMVHDIAESRVAELVEAGALPADCCAEVADICDIIILLLLDGPDVEVAVVGSEGVLEGARKGSVVLDMSSISPILSARLRVECKDAGLEFLDASVSGGESRAVDGTLSISVGSESRAFERVLPILRAMGSSVIHARPVGAGKVPANA
jgi:2-hydroxy-3-oxopropionate reductase